MKLRNLSAMLAGSAFALLLTGGVATAHPTPQRHQNSQKSQKSQKKESKYPNATRKEPKLDLKKKSVADDINKGLQAVNAGDMDQARKLLEPYASGKKGKSKYAQTLALQGMANIAYKGGDLKTAINRLDKALQIGLVPNDSYFQMMYELAQFQAADKQYQDALTTLQKWRKEGKRETADSYGLEGILDYRLEHYKQAITAIKKAKSMTNQPKQTWDQVLAASYAETGQGTQAIAMAKKQLKANPDDAATRHNLVSLLISANKYDEALKQMQQARSKGELTDSQSYINLAKLYLLAGQNSDKDPKPYADKALAALKEGRDKGIVKSDYDYYKLKASAELVGSNKSAALKDYTKAAAMGTDGSAELRRAQLLAQANKHSSALSAARKALKKGTSHKGRAYMLIAESQKALGHKSAAVKAMKKAAQDPETSADAKAWLKKSGH